MVKVDGLDSREETVHALARLQMRKIDSGRKAAKSSSSIAYEEMRGKRKRKS